VVPSRRPATGWSAFGGKSGTAHACLALWAAHDTAICINYTVLMKFQPSRSFSPVNRRAPRDPQGG